MIIHLVDWLNRRAKWWACRMVQLTGQAPQPLHPKHLWEAPWHGWYLKSLDPSDMVLDVGCGSGTHANRALARGAVIAAMDLGPRPPRLSLKIHYAQGDAAKYIPWPDGFFTRVLALDVLEHVEGRTALLREIHRVLDPRGSLYLTVPNAGTRWRRRLRGAGLDSRQDPDHKIEYLTRLEVAEELYCGGFWLATTMAPIVYDSPWAGLLDLAGACCPHFYRAQARWKRRRAIADPGNSTGFAVIAHKLVLPAA